MNPLVPLVKELMEKSAASWAVFGGFALDLFLNRTIRAHGDIDVCVFEEDRKRLVGFLLAGAWRLYEFQGQGRVKPIRCPDESAAGRNLMGLKEGCRLVDFRASGEPGLLVHTFHPVGIAEFDYIELLFNTCEDSRFVFDKDRKIGRDMAKAIICAGGIPYLAPELALLFKAGKPGPPPSPAGL